LEQREIVVQAQAGNHEAFTILVTDRIDRLYVTARLILGRTTDPTLFDIRTSRTRR
jgi:hypothetical protein